MKESIDDILRKSEHRAEYRQGITLEFKSKAHDYTVPNDQIIFVKERPTRSCSSWDRTVLAQYYKEQNRRAISLKFNVDLIIPGSIFDDLLRYCEQSKKKEPLTSSTNSSSSGSLSSASSAQWFAILMKHDSIEDRNKKEGYKTYVSSVPDVLKNLIDRSKIEEMEFQIAGSPGRLTCYQVAVNQSPGTAHVDYEIKFYFTFKNEKEPRKIPFYTEANEGHYEREVSLNIHLYRQDVSQRMAVVADTRSLESRLYTRLIDFFQCFFYHNGYLALNDLNQVRIDLGIRDHTVECNGHSILQKNSPEKNKKRSHSEVEDKKEEKEENSPKKSDSRDSLTHSQNTHATKTQSTTFFSAGPSQDLSSLHTESGIKYCEKK